MTSRELASVVQSDGCDQHQFAFLRQERRNTGSDRNPVFIVSDVFYCSKCLQRATVDVEKRTPRSDSFDERVERLA